MRTKFLLFAVVFSFVFSGLKAQMDVGDSLALVDLYNSTSGKNWTNHMNWLTKKPVSSWYGIGVKENRVATIYLGMNNVDGSLPFSIGNLTGLEELSMGYNRIQGALPASTGNLINLTFLSIFHNQLSGEIPATIGNLSQLNELNLNTNFLVGEIPATIKNLTRLVWVSLEVNQLTQSENIDLPDFFGDKTRSIKLWDNHFTFSGLESIRNRAPFWIQISPQANLSIHSQGGRLALSAGGTLRNNTYYWYKMGDTKNIVIKGDSTFQPTVSGQYYAKVTNKLITQLILYTDTVTFTMPVKKTEMIVTLSPNPARGMISIYGLDEKSDAKITIADMSGYVWVTAISRQQSAMRLDVSRLKAGNYLVTVNDGEVVKTVMFVKE